MRQLTLLLLVPLFFTGNTFQNQVKGIILKDKTIKKSFARNASPSGPDLGFPDSTFPKKNTWFWSRAEPKRSLKELNPAQDKNAKPWILNIIEFIHWFSFPAGFFVAGYIFSLAPILVKTELLDGDYSRVYFMVLGLLSQVFGGGISGNMMHMYEGWQVTPFENLIELPANPTESQLDLIRVQNNNNAWLRTVAYQILFAFQSFGLSCFSLAVFGYTPWMITLLSATFLIPIIGPKKPMLTLHRNVNGVDRPVLPLSISLTLVFAVNVILNLVANAYLFTPTFTHLTGNLYLGIIVSLVAPTLIGLGGAIEGYFAESSFNQWDHFIAFVILVTGLGASGLTFQAFASFMAL